MRPLSIRFFTSLALERGTYFRFHNLAVALRQKGQEVEIHSLDPNTNRSGRTELRQGVAYHLLHTSKDISWINANHPFTAIKRAQRRYSSCDIAHLFQPFAGAAAPWFNSSAKAKFYDWDDLWVGGLLTASPKNLSEAYGLWSIWSCERFLPRIADHVTVCSHFLKERAQKLDAKHTTVIYNGLWPNALMSRNAARELMGFDTNGLYIGFMGRTCDELEWCFDALENAMGYHPRLRLALCGMNSDYLSKLSTKVRSKIDYLGLLKPDQTNIFARALDFGLLPLAQNQFNQSRFPIKYAEYLGAGTPVIVSNVGECAILSQGCPWVILAGTGRTDWIAAVRYSLARAESGAMCPVDQPRVFDQYSWAAIADRLLEAYQKALSAKRDGPVV